MLPVLFVAAFAAVPFTLYFPPIRNFNLMTQTIQHFMRDATRSAVRLYPYLTFAFSRIFASPRLQLRNIVSSMGKTSESVKTRPWLWIIEALAGFEGIDISTLLDLIEVFPVVHNDLGKNTRELVAMRYLEALFGSVSGVNSHATSLDSRVGPDFPLSCEDVLQEILQEVLLSDMKISGAELLKRNIYPAIMNKRANTIKCELEQLKQSVTEGTHPCAERLRERSGLALQNRDYKVPASDGKCNDLSKKGNENCIYVESMEATENASSSKRNRDYSNDEHAIQFLHEKQVGVEYDDFLRNAKKNKCYAPSDIESKKDERVHPHRRDVSENSTKRVLLTFEKGGQHTQNDHVATLGEGSVLKDCHDRCTTSNWCRSNSHNEVSRDVLDIPFSTTMRPQHTFGGKPCQQQVESITTNVEIPDQIPLVIYAGDVSTTMIPDHTLGGEPCQNTYLHETKDNSEHHIEPVPTNIGDLGEIQRKSNKYQCEQKIGFQLKHPTAADPNNSQKLVASDETIVVAVNGRGGEHSNRIDFADKNHEFLSSSYISRQDFSASTEWGEGNLCMKCKKSGTLLICKTTTCQLMVHESCLGAPVRLDAEGNFFCPFCAYSNATSKYLEAKKKAFLAKEDLCTFLGKTIEHRAGELCGVRREENNLSVKPKCDHVHVKENGNDWLPGTRREDNPEDHIKHVNEINNPPFERSQQQAEPPTSCDNLLPSCREEGIEKNRIEAKFPSVNQNNTGKKIQLHVPEQHKTNQMEGSDFTHDDEEDNISEDDPGKPINSSKSPPIPQFGLRRRKIPWTAEEEEILREGVHKFGVGNKKMPWKQILEFGSNVFLKERTTGDLKDKWKNICKAKSKSN
ncbi:uncharacterized protein G2W53_043205 [Senna tora]|uniref:Myb-like domain-containing protein n=1 Tax=Senna tora TaxID=362788 RepID=A0A834W4P6_9FABA|nr:uncharacterized protein G2W53_043205 [Senna tora]